MGKKRKPVFDMSWQEMGIQMLATEDLDPVYVMLRGAVKQGLDRDTLKRFMLAYWIYYNSYTAAYVAESPDFYTAMWKCLAAKSPHGFERRFMWGKQAVNAINGLIHAGEPERVVDDMTIHDDFWSAYYTIKAYIGFGPWISFKIVDMTERVLKIPIDVSSASLALYKDPIQGAATILFKDKLHPISDDELSSVIHTVIDTFKDVMAPPDHDRPVGIMEAETILCKYKAHVYGAYPLNNDTRHLHPSKGDFKTDLGDWLSTFIPYNEAI